MSNIIKVHIVTCNADQQGVRAGESWASTLEHFLGLAISQLHGTKPRILMHTDKLPEELSPNDTLIFILSPSLVQNKALLEGLESLWQHASTHKKANIFKVVKAPVEDRAIPSGLQSLLAYSFFHFNPETGTTQPYEQFSLLESDNAFWGTLVDLAYDLIESVQPESTRMINIGQGSSVYLAATEEELESKRGVVRRELRRYGYRVLPEQQFPKAPEKLNEFIFENLQQSIFSLHLINEEYGNTIHGSEETLESLQLACCEQHAKDNPNTFQRLIWLSPSLHVEDERQLQLIDQLREQADATQGMEVVQVKLEDLKSLLLQQLVWQMQKLAKLKNKADATGGESLGQSAMLYMVVDERDREKAKPLVEYWEQKGVDVYWIGNQPQSNHRNSHVKFLNSCDACIVFAGGVSEPWLITKLQDILKSPGLGRKSLYPPLSAVALVTNPEDQEESMKKIADILGKYPQYHSIELLSAIEGSLDQTFDSFRKSISENLQQEASS